MVWYEILAIILGALGGTGGVVALYKAKSQKDALDINNFHSLLEEERTERELIKQEFKDYKDEVERKVNEVKKDFEKLRQENGKLTTAIFRAYRCKYPEKTDDCPVIKAYQKEHKCDGCNNEIKNKNVRKDT